MESSCKDNDFVSNPPTEPIILPHPHQVGDKVSFTMPWMGGRDVYVAGVIVAIEAPNALLTFIGFFDSGDETGIEPLANLYPWNAESQADLESFDDSAEPDSHYTNQDD
jgi:hypothetical protein